jgi:hypothetical protein
LITCDAEISFINYNRDNILSKLSQFFNNKRIFGGISLDHTTITVMRDSAEIFNSQQREQLNDLTLNFTLYTWWSNVPVYRTADLPDFLELTSKLNYHFTHFDHIMYQYYLVLYHQFEFINMTPYIGIWWSLESHALSPNLIDILFTLKYTLDWVSSKAYNMNKQYYNQCGAFLAYHLDRKVVSSLIPCPSDECICTNTYCINDIQFCAYPGLVDCKGQPVTVPQVVTPQRHAYLNLSNCKTLDQHMACIAMIPQLWCHLGKIELVVSQPEPVLKEILDFLNYPVTYGVVTMDNICVFPVIKDCVHALYTFQNRFKHIRRMRHVALLCDNERVDGDYCAINCDKTPLATIVHHIQHSDILLVSNQIIFQKYKYFMADCNISSKCDIPSIVSLNNICSQ